MAYRSLNDIADDVIALLEAGKVFRSVTRAAIDNYQQLLEHAANITSTPKAIVCIGAGDWGDHGFSRSFTVAVVVFASYRATAMREAETVWQLVEAAAAPFLPVYSGTSAPVFPEINGVKYELKSWSPLESSAKTASFVVEIDAVEVFKLETEEE